MESEKKKIFVLLSRFPYPLDKGDKLRAFHQLKILAQKHDVFLFSVSDKKVKKSEIEIIEQMGITVEIAYLKKRKILVNLIRYFFSKNPFQVGYFYHSFVQNKIESTVKSYQPDAIYCQLIRMAEYTKKIQHPHKILDYMDALSSGMEKRYLIEKNFLKKIAYRIEFLRLKNYERDIFSFFKHCSIITKADRQLIDVTEKNEIEVIPNGIDTSFFLKNNSIKKYDILFTGNMSYPPNEDAALFLIKEVMPKVWLHFSKAKLLIAGSSPTLRLKNLASDKVIISGWIDDIRTAYNESKVFAAPLRLGSGLQNKLLEAMAMEMPCITSEMANEALGAKVDNEIFIAKNSTQFSVLIVDFLKNENKSEEIGKNARNFVKENFDWIKTTENLNQLLMD